MSKDDQGNGRETKGKVNRSKGNMIGNQGIQNVGLGVGIRAKTSDFVCKNVGLRRTWWRNPEEHRRLGKGR